MRYIKTYEFNNDASINTVIKHKKTGKVIRYDSKYVILQGLLSNLSIHQVLETSDTHSIIQLLYSYPPLEEKDNKPMSISRNIFELKAIIMYEGDNLEDAINNLELIYNTNKYNL